MHNGTLTQLQSSTKLCPCREMGGTEDCYIKWNKPDSVKQVSYTFSHMENL